MNTKELTRNTRHAIEDMLASQGITTTGIIDRRLEEILQDHNTAYKDAIAQSLETTAIYVLHNHNIHWTDVTTVYTYLLRTLLNKLQQL